MDKNFMDKFVFFSIMGFIAISLCFMIFVAFQMGIFVEKISLLEDLTPLTPMEVSTPE